MKNESDAIKAAIRMLKSEFSIVKVILFGSKARGDHDEYSDIDLLVVASRSLHWKEEKAIVGALFDIGMEHNVIFSPLFTSSDEWEAGIRMQCEMHILPVSMLSLQAWNTKAVEVFNTLVAFLFMGCWLGSDQAIL
jgi:predicted nucleotidyltransferase